VTRASSSDVSACDDPASLSAVDQPRDGRPVEPQVIGEGRHAGGSVAEDTDQPKLGHRQVEVSGPRARADRRREADLDERIHDGG